MIAASDSVARENRMDSSVERLDEGARRRRELAAFLFLTVVLAPLLSVLIVGGYGFAIWVAQMILGPPGA